MPCALTAVAVNHRTLLALLGVSLSTACFDPGGADPFTTATTTDPTASTTGDPPPATTGDATVDPDSGDATAGGTSSDTTGDATTSSPAMCGNRVVEGDEECDDGPANGDTAACKADCTLAFCGDGSVYEGTEECDDADDDDSDECPTTCRSATCGDGFLYADMEECDAGGESEACDVDCTLPSCGDGVTNVLAGEECDDANAVETDACPTTCLNATCGDGNVWAGMEECDTDDVGAASCTDFGLSGDLACSEQCALDTTNCFAGCPDGGAFVNNMCWYLSVGCDATNVTCASHGLTGVDGYINTVWDMPTMQAIANQYGWAVGGDIACCVEFGWVQAGAIYTHNFGPQFYNWPGCYDVYPTVKACNPP